MRENNKACWVSEKTWKKLQLIKLKKGYKNLNELIKDILKVK